MHNERQLSLDFPPTEAEHAILGLRALWNICAREHHKLTALMNAGVQGIHFPTPTDPLRVTMKSDASASTIQAVDDILDAWRKEISATSPVMVSEILAPMEEANI